MKTALAILLLLCAAPALAQPQKVSVCDYTQAPTPLTENWLLACGSLYRNTSNAACHRRYPKPDDVGGCLEVMRRVSEYDEAAKKK